MSDSIQLAAAHRAAAIAMLSRNLAARLSADQEKRVTPAALARYREALADIERDVAALETIINRMEAL